jgi:hypothetical protein
VSQLVIAPKRPPAVHADLVSRLSGQSVAKHFDAYADIDWDSPDFAVDPHDPRFERPADCGLGKTEWYRSLPGKTRAKLGLHLLLEQLHVGIDFESILSRGLLEYATTLEPGSPNLRYAYHEIIEEAQHSLMFQEAIARAGLPTRGLSGIDRLLARRVPALGRKFPELFFMHVLGGEGPIDHFQKTELTRRNALHPLVRKIMQVHVTEEARHISFAKSWLREHMPRASRMRRIEMRFHTPILLAVMSRQMIEPPRWLLDLYGVPHSVRREAFHEDPEFRRRLAEGLRPVRDLALELEIATPMFEPLWRGLGVWAPQETTPRLTANVGTRAV